MFRAKEQSKRGGIKERERDVEEVEVVWLAEHRGIAATTTPLLVCCGGVTSLSIQQPGHLSGSPSWKISVYSCRKKAFDELVYLYAKLFLLAVFISSSLFLSFFFSCFLSTFCLITCVDVDVHFFLLFFKLKKVRANMKLTSCNIHIQCK